MYDKVDKISIKFEFCKEIEQSLIIIIITIIITHNVCTIVNNRNVSPMNLLVQTFGKIPECRELNPLNVVLFNPQSDGTNINNCAFRSFRLNPN